MGMGVKGGLGVLGYAKFRMFCDCEGLIMRAVQAKLYPYKYDNKYDKFPKQPPSRPQSKTHNPPPCHTVSQTKHKTQQALSHHLPLDKQTSSS